jgi:hypothetical protein
MADSRLLSDIQQKNCAADSCFLWVRCPPRKTGFNPFGQGSGAFKSRKWAEDEIKRIVACLNAPVKQITFQKNNHKDGKGFAVSAYVWFKPGMHPKAVKKLKKGKPLKITWKIHVRKDHDAEKYGDPMTEWEWRFMPATYAPLTKAQLVARRNKRNETKTQDLDLSSDSESENDDNANEDEDMF